MIDIINVMTGVVTADFPDAFSPSASSVALARSISTKYRTALRSM